MGKIVAISHSKGGVGKTSVARNIALSQARDGLKILALDCDPQKSLETFFADRAERLDKQELVCVAKSYSKGLAREIKSLSEGFDLVVVDVGGSRDSDVMRQVLIASNAAIVPTRPGQEDLDSLDLFMQVVDEVRGVNEGLDIFIVINQAPVDTFDTVAKTAAEGLAEKFREDAVVCDTYLKHRKSWLKSAFNAEAIWEVDGPNSKAANEFEALIEEMRGMEVF